MINQNILFLAFNFIIKTITLATLFDNLENKMEYTLRKTKPHSVINMFKWLVSLVLHYLINLLLQPFSRH